MPDELFERRIAVIGLGYVGLPLALAFAKHFEVVGFDLDTKRIDELVAGFDGNQESEEEDFLSAKSIRFTSNSDDLQNSDFFVIAVPTPIDEKKVPDLSFLIEASEIAGRNLKVNDIVVYESTVYPGCTEEVCVPVLEQISQLKFNCDFFCGYSPERVNPGDKSHRLENIVKVTAGSNRETTKMVDNIYRKVITAGTFPAQSIRVAEAAKVIENTQRDLNIALINELSQIFHIMDIDTEHVLAAACTKWNFLDFKPGLVGGHCIGVDPYYLTFKSQQLGYNPTVILAGRRLNDNMPYEIFKRVANEFTKRKISLANAQILVMGATFKEDCPDLRNSLVFCLIEYFRNAGSNLDVYDIVANQNELAKKLEKPPVVDIKRRKYDAIIIAVAHSKFKELGSSEIKSFGKQDAIIFDVKWLLKPNTDVLKL